MQGTDGCNELFGDVLGAVGGAVVDDYDFPVKVSVCDWVSEVLCDGWFVGEYSKTYCALKVCSRSQTMIGRLRRSL